MARPDTFTDDEKRWLTENYAHASWEDILGAIRGKTKTQIISKASKMNLARSQTIFAVFGEEEDDIIRQHYIKLGADGIVKYFLPQRTKSSIVTRASKIGVHKQGCWTKEEDDIITSCYYEMPMEQLALLLPNRAKSAIHWRIKQLGLSGAARYKYSDEAIKFIADNYQTMSDEEIAEHLHRAPASIKELRRKKGLYRRDPNLPTQYRYLGTFIHRNDCEWKKESARRCGYKCFITGLPFDAIHHLYSRNSIIKDVCESNGIPEDIDINNASQEEKDRFLQLYRKESDKHPFGICLIEEIHKNFHSLYGYGDNTIQQFQDFVQRFYPEKTCALNELIS